MILSRIAIVRARHRALSSLGPLPVLREHFDRAAVLKLGFRLMTMGWLAGIVCVSSVLVAEATRNTSAHCGLGIAAALAMYAVMAGKLACFAAPIGRRLVAAHWVLLVVFPFAVVWSGDLAAGNALLAASSIPFLAFLYQLARHLDCGSVVSRLRWVGGLYGLALLPWLALPNTAAESDGPALSALLVCAGTAVYVNCLFRLSRALPASAKPLQPRVLLKDLTHSLRTWLWAASRMKSLL